MYMYLLILFVFMRQDARQLWHAAVPLIVLTIP